MLTQVDSSLASGGSFVRLDYRFWKNVCSCLRATGTWLQAGNRMTSIIGFNAQREDNGFQEREQAGARSRVQPVLVFSLSYHGFVLLRIVLERHFKRDRTRETFVTPT